MKGELPVSTLIGDQTIVFNLTFKVKPVTPVWDQQFGVETSSGKIKGQRTLPRFEQPPAVRSTDQLNFTGDQPSRRIVI
jgi:hypothetical protein